MPRHSAGLLPYRDDDDGGLLVFVGHMGGPFWARRDASWSIVKGEFDPDTETAQTAAAREFTEEAGVPAPQGPWMELGTVRQSGGKIVTAFAVRGDGALQFDASAVDHEAVEIEWPPRSGRRVTFPEIDDATWMPLARARDCLVRAQTAFLDRLDETVRGWS